MQLIKNSTASAIFFLLVDTATGQAGQTGKAGSAVVKVSKNGTTYAAAGGTVAEVDSANGPGIYKYTNTTAEANTNGMLLLQITCPGCQNVDKAVQVVAFDPNDAAALGLTRLDATIGSRAVPGDAMALTTGERTAVGTAVWATTVRALTDKTGFALTQAFPANFSALVISGGGAVTAGTISDKTGYSLSSPQAFNNTGQTTVIPANTTQVNGVAAVTPPTANDVSIAVGNSNIIQNIAAASGTVTGGTRSESGTTVVQSLKRPDGGTLTKTATPTSLTVSNS